MVFDDITHIRAQIGGAGWMINIGDLNSRQLSIDSARGLTPQLRKEIEVKISERECHMEDLCTHLGKDHSCFFQYTNSYYSVLSSFSTLLS